MPIIDNITHKIFKRGEKNQQCRACQKLPSGLPCYECTFHLQTPPPHYTSVSAQHHHSSPGISDRAADFDVSSLAHGVSKIGLGLLLSSHNTQGDSSSPIERTRRQERTRHWSGETSRSSGSRYSGHLSVSRIASAPHLSLLDSVAEGSVLPEPPQISPGEEIDYSPTFRALSPDEREAFQIDEEALPDPPSLSPGHQPTDSDLLAAISTVTPPLHPPRESSPLPCQLLIPE